MEIVDLDQQVEPKASDVGVVDGGDLSSELQALRRGYEGSDMPWPGDNAAVAATGDREGWRPPCTGESLRDWFSLAVRYRG